ncbi:MAG: alpha/beta hydrolase family protein [Candidatus Sumerlaeia bacterium]
MSPKKQACYFSPYDNHRWLMERMEQSLSYANACGGELKAWQNKLRRKLRQLTGYDKMPKPAERCALDVRTEWEQERHEGFIRKIIFQSEEHAHVPAYVCLPRSATPPYRFVICVQGHSSGMHNSIRVERDDEAKTFSPKCDRDFGITAMQSGLAALCIEQRAFGLRREQTLEKAMSGTCHDATMHALMLGRTMIAERVFDIDRGIDYLATRDDADMKRIGVMGNSGGGTASLFSAALLPRISLCMPSCYFCTFRDSVMSIGHCMDNYVPGLLQYAEMPDLMGLFAPKPVVVVAGREDNIFPIDATEKAFRALKKIYKAAGASDRCKLVIGEGGHRFYAQAAWPEYLKMLERI